MSCIAPPSSRLPLCLCLFLLLLLPHPAAVHAAELPSQPTLWVQAVEYPAGGQMAAVLDRLVILRAGDLIDSAALIQVREELETSNVVENVSLYTARGDTLGAVILFVEADLVRGVQFETGLGRERMAGWYLNLLGIRLASPFARGGHLQIGVRSERRQTGLFLDGSYPRFLRDRFDLLIEGEAMMESWPVREEDLDLYQEIHRGRMQLGLRDWRRSGPTVSLWLWHLAAKPDDWLKSDEDDEPGEETGRLVPNPDGWESYLGLRLDLSWDGRDGIRPWQRGRWLGLRLELADAQNGAPFWGLEIDGDQALPLGRRYALATRLRAVVAGPGTPYHLRPVVGGVGSLRGFEPAGLSGPLGASALWQCNLELRLPLTGKNPNRPRIMQTLFLDCGDSWDSEYQRHGFSLSTGFGLLFSIPWIQTLNTEVAFPLTENHSYDSVLTTISLGRSF